MKMSRKYLFWMNCLIKCLCFFNSTNLIFWFVYNYSIKYFFIDFHRFFKLRPTLSSYSQYCQCCACGWAVLRVTRVERSYWFFSNGVGDSTPIFFQYNYRQWNYYLLRLASLLGEVNNRVFGLYFFRIKSQPKKIVLTLSFFFSNLDKSFTLSNVLKVNFLRFPIERLEAKFLSAFLS